MGVWALDLETGQSTWNTIEYELLGLYPDENPASEELFYRYMHPEDILPVQEAVRQAISQKTEFNSEFRINRADGQLRWLVAKARVITDANGTAIKVIGVNYDITERKLNEEALRAADLRKDDFLAALGHELRNPLNALSGSISLMQTAEIDRTEALHKVASRQLNHLTRLVDDLLDVSRIAHQKIQLCREPMDLTQLLHHLVADYQSPAAEAKITLNVILPKESVWIHGDAIRLTQAFSNVLQNAIKFSDPNSQIDITTTLERRRNFICCKNNRLWHWYGGQRHSLVFLPPLLRKTVA